jgi:hypothetical protein
MADQLPDSIGPDLAYALQRLADRWLPFHGLVEARQALALAVELAPASHSSEDLGDQLSAIASGARSLAPEPSPEPNVGASREPAPDSPKSQLPDRTKSAAA